MLRVVFLATMVLFVFSQTNAQQQRHPCTVALERASGSGDTCTPNMIAVSAPGNGTILLCKSLNRSELTQLLNCSGGLDTSLTPITPPKSSQHRRKRSGISDLNPGEVFKGHCDNRYDSVPSNDLYMVPCGVCSNTERHRDNNYFPQYTTHFTCNPAENSSFSLHVGGQPLGRCVQKVKDQNVLYWDPDGPQPWVNDRELTELRGQTVVVQNWDRRTISTNSSCELQLFNPNIFAT